MKKQKHMTIKWGLICTLLFLVSLLSLSTTQARAAEITPLPPILHAFEVGFIKDEWGNDISAIRAEVTYNASKDLIEEAGIIQGYYHSSNFQYGRPQGTVLYKSAADDGEVIGEWKGVYGLDRPKDGYSYNRPTTWTFYARTVDGKVLVNYVEPMQEALIEQTQTAVTDGPITVKLTHTDPEGTSYYRVNMGEWIPFTETVNVSMVENGAIDVESRGRGRIDSPRQRHFVRNIRYTEESPVPIVVSKDTDYYQPSFTDMVKRNGLYYMFMENKVVAYDQYLNQVNEFVVNTSALGMGSECSFDKVATDKDSGRVFVECYVDSNLIVIGELDLQSMEMSPLVKMTRKDSSDWQISRDMKIHDGYLYVMSEYERGTTDEVENTLSKYDLEGNLIWSKELSSIIDYFVDIAISIEFDESGNMYINTMHEDRNTDAMITKLDADMNILWHHKVSGNGIDEFSAIAIDSQGNVAAQLSTWSTDLPYNRGFNANNTVILLKLDPEGKLLWSDNAWGNNDTSWGSGVLIDSQDRIVSYGQSNNTNGLIYPVIGKYGADNQGIVTRHLPDGTRDGGFGVESVYNSNVNFMMESDDGVLVGGGYSRFGDLAPYGYSYPSQLEGRTGQEPFAFKLTEDSMDAYTPGRTHLPGIFLTPSTTEPTPGPLTVTLSYENAPVEDVSHTEIWFENSSDYYECPGYCESFEMSQNDTAYAYLEMNDGTWANTSLSVSNIQGPTVSFIQSPIEKTNTDVTVTPVLEGMDVSEIESCEVRFRNEQYWDATSYEGWCEDIVFQENDIVFITFSTNSGNYYGDNYEYRHEVKNIDKVAPNTPVITPSVTGPSNEPVTATIAYESSNDRNEYRINGGDWKRYRGGVTLYADALLEARATDAATNVSEIASYSFTEISVPDGDPTNPEKDPNDDTPPATPVITPSNPGPTNEPVTITVTFESEQDINEVRINNGEWLDYTAPFTVYADVRIQARATDVSDNRSAVATLDIRGIEIDGNDPDHPTTPPGEEPPVEEEPNPFPEDPTDPTDPGEGGTDPGLPTCAVQDISRYVYVAELMKRDPHVTTAIQKVAEMEDACADKAALEARMAVVVEWIAERDYQLFKEIVHKNLKWAQSFEREPYLTALDASEDLREEDQPEVDAAKQAIYDAMTQKQIDAAVKAANTQVGHAERYKRDPYLTRAAEFIDKVPYGTERDALQARLDAVLGSVSASLEAAKVTEATAAVTKAETGSSIFLIDEAQLLVTALTDSPEKDALQGRLDAIELTDEMLFAYDLKSDILALEVAEERSSFDAAFEATKAYSERTSSTNLNRAEAALAALAPYSESQADLYERLAQYLADVKAKVAEDAMFAKAGNTIALAERFQRQIYVTRAQGEIDLLPEGERRDALQARLDAIVL